MAGVATTVQGCRSVGIQQDDRAGESAPRAVHWATHAADVELTSELYERPSNPGIPAATDTPAGNQKLQSSDAVTTASSMLGRRAVLATAPGTAASCVRRDHFAANAAFPGSGITYRELHGAHTSGHEAGSFPQMPTQVIQATVSKSELSSPIAYPDHNCEGGQPLTVDRTGHARGVMVSSPLVVRVSKIPREGRRVPLSIDDRVVSWASDLAR